MKSIKVIHINHISRTGSGNIMRNIIKGLNEYGISGHAIVGYDFDNFENTDSVYKTNKSIFYRQIRYKIFIGLNFLFDIMTPGCITIDFLKGYKYYQESDIVHIHCPEGGYFNRKDLNSILNQKKVIITLHDDRITSGNDKQNLYFPYKTKNSFENRMKYFQDQKIKYVGVSNWISNKTKEICNISNINTIYNGIDTKKFYYKNNKCYLKSQYGIPKNKKVILSLAGSGSKTNLKGLGFVNQIIRSYKQSSDLLFITIGNSKNKKISENHRELGYIDNNEMSNYFNMTDVFLYPTLADNCPLIILESIACGCPVLTFDVGGVPEIITHKKNGYIAKYKDIEDMKQGFEWILANKDTLQVELNPKFTQENMIKQYVDLYKSII